MALYRTVDEWIKKDEVFGKNKLYYFADAAEVLTGHYDCHSQSEGTISPDFAQAIQ